METMYYDDEDIVDRMMRILGIKQGNEESVEEFTKRYDSRILLWKGELPEEEKRIWYVLGLKRQYLYEVEDLLPETYDQAKQLALMVEARMKGVMNEVKDVVNDDDRENIDDADAEDRCNEAEVDEDGSMVFEWCIKSTKLGDLNTIKESANEIGIKLSNGELNDPKNAQLLSWDSMAKKEIKKITDIFKRN
ncbi:30879_t:CDS:2 [Gigaspora margarita]|uniref:30879_t:CDS:1 n=1 Tax=Gigaspora margarita TaxID=4874 RepID=A0ABN7VHS1_GIGMA|nr:30879_t:CDS:2 [Gigaspora margarita]